MHTLTLAGISTGIKARRFSSVEVTQHFLGRIERLNPALNAFITVTAEQALAQAAAADQAIAMAKGGPLTGVPLAHKDIFCTDGVLTTCAATTCSGFRPSSRVLTSVVLPAPISPVTTMKPSPWWAPNFR